MRSNQDLVQDLGASLPFEIFLDSASTLHVCNFFLIHNLQSHFQHQDMFAAGIQILFLTQKSQILLTISLQIELLVVPILFIICTPTWLSKNNLTCLFRK